MNLAPIAQYLQASGLGTVQRDIFVQLMPDKVTDGIVLLGPPLGTPIDHELPGYRRTGFQLVVRARSYANGLIIAKLASTALTISGGELDGMKINFIRPRHEPMPFPRSKGGFLEFSVNFDANYVDTNG